MRRWSCVCIFSLILIFDLPFWDVNYQKQLHLQKMLWFCSSTPCLVFLCLYCCVAVSSSVELLWEAVMKFLCFVTYLKIWNKNEKTFFTLQTTCYDITDDAMANEAEFSVGVIFFVMPFHWCEVHVFMQCLWWSWQKWK